jgi:hypothetical protein
MKATITLLDGRKMLIVFLCPSCYKKLRVKENGIFYCPDCYFVSDPELGTIVAVQVDVRKEIV